MTAGQVRKLSFSLTCLTRLGTSSQAGTKLGYCTVLSSRPKFSPTVKGEFTPASFKTLGVKIKAVLETLVRSGKASWAKATWPTYGTAERGRRNNNYVP